jgi:sodium transport system ATP-binding protein
MTQAASVEVRGLVRRYGAVQALSGIDFSVKAGEIYGLLGPNGAGKTTTMRILATLLRADEGEVRLCGLDPRTSLEACRRCLGYQTGDTKLYERLTPVEVLRYFGAVHDMPRAQVEARVEALVAGLALGEFAARRSGTLSTGQQQRVSLARALLHDPQVLILDEPTTGLDIVSSQGLLDFLRQERGRGKAILYSTHILSEVELLCDRIGVLVGGRLVAEGTAQALMEQTGAASLTHAFLRHVGQETTGGRG